MHTVATTHQSLELRAIYCTSKYSLSNNRVGLRKSVWQYDVKGGTQQSFEDNKLFQSSLSLIFYLIVTPFEIKCEH